ncbi:hypothetical protein [Paenibacillus xylanexedens]|uniref:hypothetical protein n=1 Tax=Paenibacillus xylanexedens TaxID=528191 RepID=UPI001C8E0230|nr:hypothetical protein [Paenibacillus xylanexedens]MBY0118352.1 hypothetical protein [Paenibacillus xylanexedens]
MGNKRNIVSGNKNIKRLRQLDDHQVCLFENIKHVCEGHQKNKLTIGSHIIAENDYLSRIASKDNKVLVYNIRHESYYEKEKRGRVEDLLTPVLTNHAANTRNMLCGKHDASLFDKIENGNRFDEHGENFKQQSFQFALRAFIFDYMHEKNVNDKGIKTGHSEGANFRASIGLSYREKYFKKFQKAYSENDWDCIETKVITIDKKVNFISCFSFFPVNYLKFRYSGHVNDKLFLNIFPENDKTKVVISYFKDGSVHCKRLSDLLYKLYLRKKSKKIEGFLTRCVLLYDLKVTYNPDYIKRLFKDETRKMQFFKFSFHLRKAREISDVYKNFLSIFVFEKLKLNLFDDYLN